jgi:predicted permease
MQDLRYALRALLKSPIITTVAVLSLALGIGANTAIFSVINALLLRSLPVHDPEQLVSIYTIRPDDSSRKDPLSLAMFDELRKEQRAFSAVFSASGGGLDSFEAGGQYFPGVITTVSGDYYAALGVKPILGRLIQADDVALYAGTSAQVAVLSYRCWQNRFHGDPAVVGTVVRLEDRPLTIIGVTPRSFSGLIVDAGEDVTVPLGVYGDNGFRERHFLDLTAYGRLKPGVSIEQARAQLQAVWPAVQRAAEPVGYAGARRDRYYARKADLESAAKGRANMRTHLAQPLTVLMALVGIVLFIACVNLANLMLARSAGRRHELAVRTALGASRWRLIRQLLNESIVLCVAGAALGFAIAIWTSRLLFSVLWTAPVNLALDVTPDMRVLAITSAIALLTVVLFGLAPAWRATRGDPAEALRQNKRSIRGAGRIGKALVSAQVALSLVIVLAAALFVHSLKNMQSVDPGFQRHGLLVMQLFAQPGRQISSNFAAYYREIVNQVCRLPGVVSASFSTMGPVNRFEFKSPVTVDGLNDAPEQAVRDALGPGFFRMAGMRVIAGREFEWSDDEKAPLVAVISQSLATRLFSGRNPIGQFVDLDRAFYQKPLRIVGVVNSASLWRVQSREPMAIYTPLLQSGPTGSYLDIRSEGDPRSLAAAATKIVERLGHEYPLYIQTLEQRMDKTMVDERMVAGLSAFIGGLALLLASIGLYGLMANSVIERTSEIGIRMALGAERGNVIRLVLGEVLILVGTGILIGIPVALAASKYIAGMLFGLSATDPATIAIAVVALLTVALFAGYFPAQYASRIDPITALRMD